MFTACCNNPDDRVKDAYVSDTITRVQPQEESQEILGLSQVEEIREERDEAPELEAREVTFERFDDSEWGLNMIAWTPFLQINSIEKGGRADGYNAELSARRKLRVDDAIIAVNGVELDNIENSKKAHSMLVDPKEKSVDLKVIRLLKRTIKITREEKESWGVNVDKQDNQKGLLVKSLVQDKPVDIHNKAAESNKTRVIHGDVIVCANGRTGMNEIIEAFKDTEARTLELSLLRVPKDSTS